MSEETIRDDDAPRHLSGRSFVVCLLILLSIFVFLNPIWQSNQMDAWNENIWWSYAPIPLLVAVFLRVEGKWSGGAFVLDTMKLTFVKFVITFIAANALWSFWGTPGAGEPSSSPLVTKAAPPSFALRPAPAATELDPQTLGDLVGVVRNAQGQPVADALVWITAGLEQHVFAPDPESLLVTNQGQGFIPHLAVLPTYARLTLRSEGPQLHTLVISDRARRRLINYPVLAGREREIMFSREHGLLELRCSVHGESEGRSLMLVTGNPFHARTGEDGRFNLRGVPSGELILAAFAPDAGGGRATATVKAGEQVGLQVHLRGIPIR